MASVDAVADPIPTSAVLMSTAKHIAMKCKNENVAFLKCKKDDANPEKCLDKGNQVTRCVLKFSLGKEMSTSKAAKVSTTVEFDVAKFDGKAVNFGMWQCQMRDTLILQGLNKALKGTDSKPKDMSDEDWEEYNLLACSTIRLHLAQNVTYYVMHEKSAASIWKKLEDKYMTKSIENRLYLKKKLFRFEYARGTSMSEHVDKFNKIISDLLNLDVDIGDEDKALLLLNSLPDSYDHLANMLLYGKDEVKFENVSSALLDNEQRLKEKCSSSSDTLLTRGRMEGRKQGGRSNSRSKSKTRNPKNLKCFKCQKKGHFIKDCPILKAGYEKTKTVEPKVDWC